MKIMKSFVQRFLRLFCKRLVYRGMYAIHIGDKSGAFFVNIEEESKGNSYAILIMPNPMEAKYVAKSEIVFDLKYNNIKFVKTLPLEVYEVCKANFIYYAKKAGIYVGR